MKILFLIALVNFILCFIGGIKQDLNLGITTGIIGILALAGGWIVAWSKRDVE